MSVRKRPEEWFRQAEYDMDTARYMFAGGRYFYCVFMCHLSIEKALKGLHAAILRGEPPRIHNLLYFVEKLRLKPPAELFDCVYMLNRASVPTRYPDELRDMAAVYDKDNTRQVLTESEKALAWLKTQLPA